MESDLTGDWMELALVDLEARKAKIESLIAHIRELQSLGTPSGPHSPGGVRPDAFLKMSIPDASKKHLAAARQKQSTTDLMAALENGGLPPVKYNTLYTILRRREKQVGDIINMQGDWALREWYPNYRPSAKDPKNGTDAKEKKTDSSTADEEVSA
ncbi:MAG: hypothetical protein GEU82_16435 [Luteitalea sp.]|nr:hypothetical protein [Luteitalea sp.]